MTEIAPRWEGTSLREAMKQAKEHDTLVMVPHYELWAGGMLALLDGDNGDEDDAATAAALDAGWVVSWILRAKTPFLEAAKKLLPPRRRFPKAEREHIFSYG